MLKRDRALSTIVLAVKPSLLYLIGDPEDPVIVWKKLSNQFQKKTWANKLALRRRLYSLKMKAGKSVQEHVKEMTEIFEELSVIGDPVDEEDQVIHLLASLPESFDMLVTALEAGADVPKLEVVTERLLHEESKMKDKETYGESPKAMTSRHHNLRKGPKCYHCGKIGHIKRNCWILTKKTEKSAFTSNGTNRIKAVQDAHTAEEQEVTIGLVAGDALKANRKSNWIVDSGATCHMCNEEELFTELSPLETTQDITVGDGHSLPAIGKGTIILEINVSNKKNVVCKLSDVLFVPQLSYNLLSVSKAARNGKKFEFGDSKCHITDAKLGVIGTATKYGNLYYLNCNGLKDKENHTAMKCSGSAQTKEDIWHRRYGHLGGQNLKRLARDNLVEGFDYELTKDSSFCEPCVDGKHHRSTFPKTGASRSTELLGIVHSDVCGKIDPKSLSGAEYFVTFVDDKSRYTWIYVLKRKSEVFQKFVEWKTMVEKSSGKSLKVLRTDNGGEYTSNEFEEYLRKEGIKHECTVPKTPEQNGVAERMNRTLVETIRTMLSDSSLPKKFWAEALSTATYIRNRSPTNALKETTPYEVWTNCKPNVKHLRVFGCNAYAHVPKDERSKLDFKAKKAIFLGYGTEVKGYRLYDVEKSRVFFSRDVIFDESKAEENEKENSESEATIDIGRQEENENDVNEPEPAEPRRSARERRAPDRYGDWANTVRESDNPSTVKEALSSPDADDWKNAMKREMQSLDKNEVWDLIELPSGRKAIGSKFHRYPNERIKRFTICETSEPDCVKKLNEQSGSE